MRAWLRCLCSAEKFRLTVNNNCCTTAAALSRAVSRGDIKRCLREGRPFKLSGTQRCSVLVQAGPPRRPAAVEVTRATVELSCAGLLGTSHCPPAAVRGSAWRAAVVAQLKWAADMICGVPSRCLWMAISQMCVCRTHATPEK